MKCRKVVQAIDLSGAPVISWPEKPV
ncbi:hypothetical protein [Pantoea agglomerans]